MKLAKRLAALALTGAMVFSMAACTSNNNNSNEDTNTNTETPSNEVEANNELSGEEVTLRMNWWGGDSRHEATQAALVKFQELYPNIKVEAEFGAWTGWTENMSTQIMSGTAPDVMQINWNWITSYSANGDNFLDLNTVSDILDLSQWRAEDLEQCTVNGNNLQAVPIALTGRVFYWNETTFAQAGLDVPSSFEDLMAAGPIFAEKLGDTYYPLVMGEYDRMIFMVYYLESVYGKNWVEDGQLNYTEEEIAVGLQLLLDMEEAHVIPTIKKIAGDGAESIDKNQNWIDGHYAGIYEWDSSATKMISAAEGSNIVVGDFMSDIGDYQGGFTKVSMGFAISANCAHPAEAALLIQFLLNEEAGVTIMASERGVPASAAGYSIVETNGLINETVAEANQKVMSYAQFTLDPYFENSELNSKPDGVYYKVMARVSYGESTPEQGAAELIAGINEVMGN